jgi:hypothetical protein
MPRRIVPRIPGFGKVGFQPLHEGGQRNTVIRLNDEVDGVIQDREIQKTKAVFLFSLLDKLQEQLFRLAGL